MCGMSRGVWRVRVRRRCVWGVWEEGVCGGVRGRYGMSRVWVDVHQESSKIKESSLHLIWNAHSLFLLMCYRLKWLAHYFGTLEWQSYVRIKILNKTLNYQFQIHCWLETRLHRYRHHDKHTGLDQRCKTSEFSNGDSVHLIWEDHWGRGIVYWQCVYWIWGRLLWVLLLGRTHSLLQ